jgi:hypothetical protein
LVSELDGHIYKAIFSVILSVPQAFEKFVSLCKGASEFENKILRSIVYRVETFLCNGSETHNGKTPFAKQQILNNANLDYKNGRYLFSTWSMPRGYKQDGV